MTGMKIAEFIHRPSADLDDYAQNAKVDGSCALYSTDGGSG